MLPRTLALLALVAASLLPTAAADADPADEAGPIDPLAPPMPPTGLHATYDAVAGAVTLAWTPAAGDVRHYAVSRNGLPLGSTEGHGFTDPAPSPLAAYTVTAVTAGGESPPSAPAVVALPPALPDSVDLRPGVPLSLEAVVLGSPVRSCEPVIVGGFPPSAHVNWACVDAAFLEG